MANTRSRWFPGLRALLSVGRELRLLRASVDRLTDAVAGTTPAVDSPPEPEEPLQVEYTRDTDHARQYAIELRLRRQLGRDPTADEIVHELDEAEHDPLEPVVVVGRRQPERDLH